MNNPILRGWVNYFAVGHSSECFSFIKDWVVDQEAHFVARTPRSRGAGFGFLADQSNNCADPKPNLLGDMPLPVPNTMTFAPIGVRL